ncbi:MAG: ChaN family lipoprotein [Bacteroidia bacterium]
MKNRHLSLFITICSILNSAILLAQADTTNSLSEKNYRIYSVKLGKEVNMQDIANDMKNYDVVFYGEEHNDSVTHYAEKTLFGLLYDTYNSTLTLSMEMFDRDVQGVMNEYMAGYIREKDFRKDARAWSNYRDYRPMVELSKEKRLDVICANSPSRYTNLAGRKGEKALEALPETSKKYFAPLPYDTATGKYYEKLQEMSGHTMMPESAKNDTAKKTAMPPMPMMNFDLVVAQSLWDATMAYSISEYLKLHPHKKVMQVNGRFHSEEGYAVVEQLRKYSPSIKILIVSSASDDNFPNIDWSQYKSLGDYILITDPKVPKTF